MAFGDAWHDFVLKTHKQGYSQHCHEALVSLFNVKAGKLAQMLEMGSSGCPSTASLSLQVPGSVNQPVPVRRNGCWGG